MSKFSKFLMATAVAAVVLPTGAMAAQVTGSSAGTFTFNDTPQNPTCDHSGGTTDCRIVSVNSGTNNQVQWGSGDQGASTLTADNVAIGSFLTAQTGVTIGELTWKNTAITRQSDLDVILIDYSLTFSFSSPGGGTGNPVSFDLDIQNTINDEGDIISGLSTSGLSFSLPGWTVNGFAISVADAAGNNGTTNFGNCLGETGGDNWCNSEGNTANLFIKANFTPTATSVPEPMTLSLFGAGLAGAAAMRLRRRKKA